MFSLGNNSKEYLEHLSDIHHPTSSKTFNITKHKKISSFLQHSGSELPHTAHNLSQPHIEEKLPALHGIRTPDFGV
jgi:hypothetical protein